MVLSRKKRKQKVRALKVELLEGSQDQKEVAEEGLEILIEGIRQQKKEKRKRKRDEVKPGLEDDGKVEEVKRLKEKKRKRKRDEVKPGLEEDGKVEEVKRLKEKKKKKQKQKKKQKEKKKGDNGDLKESLASFGHGGIDEQGVAETANTDISKGSFDASTKVYVGGIPYYSIEDDIRSYFESCGTITEIDRMTFPESGNFRGIAILNFKTEAAAKRALALDGSDMGGFFLKIQPYKSNRVGKTANFSPSIVEGYNRIYAGNLSWDITEEDLRKFFSGCSIASIRFGEDKETGEFRGYAHVDFSDSLSLNLALKLDQEIVCGRPVRISCAVPKKGSITKTKPIPMNNEAICEVEVPKKGSVATTKPIPVNNEAEAVREAETAVSGKIRRRTCYECGERGHLSTSCPKKLAADQKS